MIANKILATGYIINIDGSAIKSIIPGDFNIEKIIVGSEKFPVDLLAFDALATSMKSIISNSTINLAGATENIEYNPEFFPTFSNKSLTPEQILKKEQIEERVEAMNATLNGDNKVALIIPRTFDDIGDFVETRWEIKGKDFNLIGRILVDSEVYLDLKGEEKLDEMNMVKLSSAVKSQIQIH
jgi:hypothetical protein